MAIISVSGIDGSGKTRLAKRLARLLHGNYSKLSVGKTYDELCAVGFAPSPTEEPWRRDALALAYCMDFRRYAKGKLPTRRPIVFDRWTTCVRAYARALSSIPRELDSLLAGIPNADIDLVLDVSPGAALSRLRAREKLDDDETEETLSALQKAYLELAREQPNSVLLDASQTANQVFAEAKDVIAKRMPVL